MNNKNKNEVLLRLEVLCRLMGKKMGYSVGEWYIDYVQCYGGYIIVEAMENGGEHHPLMTCRLSKKEIILYLHAAVSVLSYIKMDSKKLEY